MKYESQLRPLYRARAVFALSIYLLAPACSSPGYSANPCADVTCSERGRCSDTNGVVSCLCDPGYHSMGLYCLKDYHLIVLQTNDRHSHWLGNNNCDYDPFVTGDGTIGGAARWMPLIKEDRSNHQNVLLLDAGDFTMGTMLVAAENGAGDLNMLKDLGFDAAALGNHEFDWGVQGFSNMLEAAEKPTVPLLCANMHFDPDDPADDHIERIYGNQGEPDKLIHPYILLEMQGGFRVGIFGLMGLNAALAINSDPISFSDSMDELADTAQSMVNKLRNEQQADVVILLAHLGLYTNGDTIDGETAELASMVSGIDAILSGHYHYNAGPAQIVCQGQGVAWTTLAMEAGKYGRHLGCYELELGEHGKSALGELITISDDLPGDPDVIARIDSLVHDVEQNTLTLFPNIPEIGAFLNGNFLQTLTTAEFDLNRHLLENNNLGYLMADALAEETGAELAVISNSGDLRSSLKRCESNGIDLSDLYNTTPLGTGPDGLLGYPVVTFYMSWSDLKTIFEHTLADKGLDDNNYIYNVSGLKIEMDTSEPRSSRIVRIIQYDPTDEKDVGTVVFEKNAPSEGWNTDQQALVKIASSLILGQVLDLAPFITLRDENGNSLYDLSSRIVFDEYDREQKLWYLVAKKLVGFENGLPHQYNDDTELNDYGPYWRRVCDINPASKLDHNCIQ